MVGETGEATARFLRSVAAGEVDARDAIARAAAVGLKRLQTPPSPLPAQPQHVSQQLARPGHPVKTNVTQLLLHCCLVSRRT